MKPLMETGHRQKLTPRIIQTNKQKQKQPNESFHSDLWAIDFFPFNLKKIQENTLSVLLYLLIRKLRFSGNFDEFHSNMMDEIRSSCLKYFQRIYQEIQ